MSGKISYPITVTKENTTVDTLTITKGGILSVTGWSAVVANGGIPNLKLEVNDGQLDPVEVYGTHRQDVVDAVDAMFNPFCGFTFDYLLKGTLQNATLSLMLDEETIWEAPFTQKITYQDYDHFFFDTNLKKKSDIYGYGPPHNTINAEVLSLIDFHIKADDRVLDFGCGTGKYVIHLKKRGINVRGLDLDTEEIAEAIQEYARDRITLYDGELPLPFPDDYFDVVISTEVLEHIDDASSILKEIHRITKRTFLMTVPDGTGVPRCHSDNVIPWHFLEETHVNFFTQKALTSLLSPYWETMQIYKFGFTQLPNSFFANNIACICETPK